MKSKKWLRKQRNRLLVRVAVIGKMTHDQLLADVKVTCDFDDAKATTEELRTILMKWAVYDAIPDAACE